MVVGAPQQQSNGSNAGGSSAAVAGGAVAGVAAGAAIAAGLSAMSVTETTSAQVEIEVAGAPLDPLVYQRIVSAEIDSSMYMPSQFRLVFRGYPNEILEPGGFQLAVPVTLQVTTGGVPKQLFMGEVTAVEIDGAPDGILTVVKGMDRSNRLMRGTKTMAYPDQVASAVVTTLIGEASIDPGEIVPTTTVYEWLTQANISSWVFIQQLAALENYVAYVDAEGLFNFGPMAKPEEGMPPVESYAETPEGTQLVMGYNLIRLRATVGSAEQVADVGVMGYDPMTSTPVVGAGPAIPSTAQSTDPGTLPAAVAAEFEGISFVDTSRPFAAEGAADKRAMAIAADIAGALSEMEGQCVGNPYIHAGESMSLGMVGLPFDGQYIVTSARHVFEPAHSGYTTWFTVGGRRDRSTFALASGAGPADHNRPTVAGVVIGKVSDNNDPEKLGRVKVIFPWLWETYVSAWARTVQIGAGTGGYGFLWVPEVGDEVLVGFDRGDVGYPYVIGNLYNGINRPEPPPSIDGAVASRRIMSRERHQIQFFDGPSASGITILSGDETLSIKIDAEEQAITIQSEGMVTVQAADALTIKSDADISIQAGGQVSVQGEGGVTVTGSDIALSAEGEASLTGASVSVEGDTDVSISGPAISLGA